MFVRRLKNLYICLCVVLLVQAGRLFHLQILSAEQDYEGRARSKLYAEETVDAMRGAIRDRNGVVLAQDRPRLDLMIDYPMLAEPERWLDDVSNVTGLDRQGLLERAARITEGVLRIRRSVWRARQRRRPRRRISEEAVKIREMVVPHILVPGVDLACVARVESQPDRFPGIGIKTTRARVYPKGRTACHVIGHLGPYRELDPKPPPAPGYKEKMV